MDDENNTSTLPTTSQPSQPALPASPFCLENAGFCSIVAEMNPRSAANRFAVLCTGARFSSSPSLSSTSIWASCVVATAGCSLTVLSCARLIPNLSISPLTSLSFLRSAPGVLLRDLCLTFPAASAWPARTSSAVRSGRASDNADRLVVFCESRAFARRFRFLRWVGVSSVREEEGFEMRETKEECLMRRLSRLDSIKDSETWAEGRWTLRGARGLERRSVAFARRVLRFVGAVGACFCCCC